MRRVQYALLAIFFALLILGADTVPVVDHAGTQADPDLVYNTQTVAVAFDDTYTSAGITLALLSVDVFTEAGAPLKTFSWTTGWTIADGVVRVPFRTEAATLANGTYRIKVRVMDTFGNVSETSDEVWLVKQWRAIDRPGGCRTLP